ncbi:MAG: Rossmann-like and DUF2520 domain-containing protein [Dehalogenimonas sp.]
MAIQNLKIGFIGAGKMGTALALSLTRAGYTVTGVASRSLDSAQALSAKLQSAAAYENPQSVADGADLILITTPDSAITEVAEALELRPGQMVCHISAATPLEALSQTTIKGAVTGVFHPLLSAGSCGKTAVPPGITFAVEAAEPLLSILRTMAAKLSGKIIELAGPDRVLYHASAILASNYLVTLVDRAAGLWQGFATKEQAVTALLPLIRGTIDNIGDIGIPECLTGPISRGDVETVRRHMTALADIAPDTMDVYRTMGLATIPVALARGSINNTKASELNELLEIRP